MTSKPIKPHKSYEDQVKLLLSRGVEIQNTTQASHILKTRNYYRLLDTGIRHALLMLILANPQIISSLVHLWICALNCMSLMLVLEVLCLQPLRL